MTAKLFSLLMGLSCMCILSTQAQDLDTLVDVGGYDLHFVIWEGEGMPILLAAGGGNDATVWTRTDFVEQLQRITQTTIITYDRSGFGQSEYDPKLADDQKSLIDYGVRDLEIGLTKLGYDRDLIFVGHSYGGFYAALFAHQYPERVQGMVLIDANHICYYSEEYVEGLKEEWTEAWFANIRNISEPVYFECLSFFETIEHMRGIEIDPEMPVIDLVAEDPPFDSLNDVSWRDCHADFVAASPQREGILAADCDHYLHFDNPSLTINAITKIFAQVDGSVDQAAILERSLAYNLQSANQYREQEYDYWHSEQDFNGWGYRLLNEEELAQAIAVFALNTALFPQSANAWDSYGEALLLAGRETEAIEMYQKSLALNPNNQNAREILERLKKK
ncbi:MAG: alpha/beta fold hydrolase [Bacteroidota bacterium]